MWNCFQISPQHHKACRRSRSRWCRRRPWSFSRGSTPPRTQRRQGPCNASCTEKSCFYFRGFLLPWVIMIQIKITQTGSFWSKGPETEGRFTCSSSLQWTNSIFLPSAPDNVMMMKIWKLWQSWLHVDHGLTDNQNYLFVAMPVEPIGLVLEGSRSNLIR